ncbi:hypothetical protein [Roseomonas marmotae]|uniref:Uncharacterized protein n=1 Tax=Roseomonas marmotae TaxID=2768161 RepID=A0ABS3KGZ0_9PROT|nr:hypothetical protein [Roseomonas marmotae]MBO1076710.1 hypothetical protein [Roseomonas marmotae]QTI79829.1 hypothetical protein IAI58_03255 [Roseomonas marmotae]
MVIRIREKADLWTLLMPPTIWALHFLFCYVVAAIHCAKQGGINLTEPSSGLSFAPLGEVRPLVAVGTAVALGLIAISARQAWRHWGFGMDDPPHDAATPEDRQHFLGYATLLLSGLSFISVVFIALPAFLIQDCR